MFSRAHSVPGDRVYCKGAVLFLSIFLSLMAFAQSAAPVDCNQIALWVGSNVPSSSVQRFIQKRGVAFSLDKPAEKVLVSAGGDASLIRVLHSMPPATPERSQPCSASIATVSAQLHARTYEDAKAGLELLINRNPKDGALHFALGFVNLQQDSLNDAFDEYSNSRDLMPGFPETHSRLAYVFYRFDDGDNAIAEARTALSMDPPNGEAYRNLGLGFLSNDAYPAALHAFQQSL